MNIKLIAVDLDGTLLDNHKQLRERTKKALMKAAEKGIHIVPATGRMWTAIPDELRELPFINYAITVNGGIIRDLKKEKNIFEHKFSYKESLDLWDYIQKFDAMSDIYTDNIGLMDQAKWPKLEYYAKNPETIKLILATRKIIPNIREYIVENTSNVVKMNMYFNDSNLQYEVRQDLNTLPYVTVTSSLVNNLELNHVSAHKGGGLKELATYLGLTIDETMVFGDGDNDITMIRQAGVGVVMGNAVDSIKKEADYVALTNEEDGVADTIERLIL